MCNGWNCQLYTSCELLMFLSSHSMFVLVKLSRSMCCACLSPAEHHGGQRVMHGTAQGARTYVTAHARAHTHTHTHTHKHTHAHLTPLRLRTPVATPVLTASRSVPWTCPLPTATRGHKSAMDHSRRSSALRYGVLTCDKSVCVRVCVCACVRACVCT